MIGTGYQEKESRDVDDEKTHDNLLIIKTAALVTKNDAEVFSLAIIAMGTATTKICNIETIAAAIHIPSFKVDLISLVIKQKTTAVKMQPRFSTNNTITKIILAG